ncbi:MAG: ferric reductase-like transmembrane domain-containing protein [Phycisphaerales bacterium]|nr:ferric reductase-like transmembrane domain-containing protein [Phycisphaerales bacterium]
MSVGFVAVQWSRHKRVYDSVAIGGVLAYLGVFVFTHKLIEPVDRATSDEIVVMRALGSCAIILLHVILCIGPLARFFPVLLPVLSNRRHLGVLTFLIALAHGVLSLVYYHGFGNVDPLNSLLSTAPGITEVRTFPFQLLGLAALVIMFLLAATSHDVWLSVLSPRVWKGLHMLVYLAYALVVAHVAFGAVRGTVSLIPGVLLSLGVLSVCGLHIAGALRESRDDRGKAADEQGWLDAGACESFTPARAKTVCTPEGERIAIFNHNGAFHAVHNVCKHQGGPLGEGKIIDGCITCPWHGWQYKPEDGCSPPPFTEQVRTYSVRIVAGRVQVQAAAQQPEPGKADPNDQALEVRHG